MQTCVLSQRMTTVFARQRKTTRKNMQTAGNTVVASSPQVLSIHNEARAVSTATQRSPSTQHNARQQPMTPRNARAAPATQRSTTTDDAAPRSCSSRHTDLASSLAACVLSDSSSLHLSPSRARQLDELLLRTLHGLQQ